MTPIDPIHSSNSKSIGPARFLFLLAAVLLSLPVPPARAQDTPLPEIEVVEAVIATDVENLIPVSPGEIFDAGVGKLYCLTRIKTSMEGSSVKHLWYYGDRMVMEITLPVKSSLWRTYSSKTILPNAVGKWRVVVTAEDGTVLRTLHFTTR